jgi:hypothetical protein
MGEFEISITLSALVRWHACGEVCTFAEVIPLAKVHLCVLSFDVLLNAKVVRIIGQTVLTDRERLPV